jgi:hypothetical protein
MRIMTYSQYETNHISGRVKMSSPEIWLQVKIKFKQHFHIPYLVF